MIEAIFLYEPPWFTFFAAVVEEEIMSVSDRLTSLAEILGEIRMTLDGTSRYIKNALREAYRKLNNVLTDLVVDNRTAEQIRDEVLKIQVKAEGLGYLREFRAYVW